MKCPWVVEFWTSKKLMKVAVSSHKGEYVDFCFYVLLESISAEHKLTTLISRDIQFS